MAKRTSKQVRIAILEILHDQKEHSYGDLERKANTNWETVRNHCEDLMLSDNVSISEYNKIRITKRGIELFKKIKGRK